MGGRLPRGPGTARNETWEKFGFFARHGVGEVCVVDPRTKDIRWFVLADDAYEQTGASPLLGVTAADLAARIDWPQSKGLIKDDAG